MHPRLAPRPGEDLMAWLDRNAIHFLKEMVAVGLDESAADSIRLDALRWLLSRAMPKPKKAQEVKWNENGLS
jgi:hypothetical protein